MEVLEQQIQEVGEEVHATTPQFKTMAGTEGLVL
jgi:hypothetical protein